MNKSLSFIFVTVLLDTIGFGIIIPVTPELIMELTGKGLSEAATYGGWLLFIYALLQFFFAPVLGNLSDSFGRRPVLLFSLVAFSLDYTLMGLAPSLPWLFAGRAVAGMAGATFTPANAYIADVSPPERRAQNFGLVGAAWGLGFIIGPVIGGFLGEYGSRLPFFVAAALAALNFIYGSLVLPESLPKHRRRPFSIKYANPIGAAFRMRRYPFVLGLFTVLLLYQIAHDANPSVWTFYTMKKFSWSEREVGYSMAFLGIMIALAQGGLIRKVIPLIGKRRAVYFGFVFLSVGFLGFAFASRGWMMFVSCIPLALGSLASPALRGIMTNQVPDDAQGELQGAITSAISLTAILAPVFMTQIFGMFASETALLYFPGAPFVVAAMLTICAILVFMMVMRISESMR